MGRLMLVLVEVTVLFAAGIVLVGAAQWAIKKLNEQKGSKKCQRKMK